MPCYLPGATSSRKSALVSLAGRGSSHAPGPASLGCHRLSLGGLCPWRLGRVRGTWLCIQGSAQVWELVVDRGDGQGAQGCWWEVGRERMRGPASLPQEDTHG